MDIPNNIIWIVLLHGIVFGVACYFIGAQRQIGALAGACLGVVLGTIGLIIVLCSGRKQPMRMIDQLQMYKSMLDTRAISEAEYNHLKGKLFESA